MKKDTHVHFRTTEEMREKIKRLAENDNRSVASYIENLVLKDEKERARD